MRRKASSLRDRRALVPRSRIRSMAREIGRRFRPERIVLFGSYAYGRPTADSDVDLLVILRTRREPADVAAEIVCAANPKFPVDLIVKTPSEVDWRLAERESFLTEIWRRGQVLYEARHA